MAITSFIHSGNIGDVWASIPAMNEYYAKTGNKVLLYLVSGQKAIYYEGANHPTKNEDGEHVILNDKMIEMMIPLLMAQSFIDEVKIWKDEKADVDLDRIRSTYVGMPNFSINRWYFYIYPDLSCDLSAVWMNVPDNNNLQIKLLETLNNSKKEIQYPISYIQNKIIISRSERYHNPNRDYFFLKKYENELVFAGLEYERDLFCNEFGLDIPLLIVNDFLELAQCIKSCRFHVSNQTMCFQISEGLKKPRILELCHFAPNVIPIGKDAYDFFSQVGLEGYVKMLHQKYPPSIKKEGAIKLASKTIMH